MSEASVPVPLDVPAAAEDPNDRHFRTNHLHADLDGRSIRGGAITLAAQAIKFVLQLTSTAILARLLTPADFGLVAMVTAVTGFVAMFKDLGLSAATIQRAEINHQQVSTLFWINLAISGLLMIVTAALAPLLAWMYHEPRLIAVTLVLAATFLMGGLTVQHDALLRRQMRLGVIAFIELVSMIAGVAAAIMLALRGAGYWSLVAMMPVSCVVGVSLVWMFTGWFPGLPAKRTGVREMLAFGGHISAYNAVGYLARNVDNVLIGWMWGPTPLGYYSKAYQLLMLPLSQVSTPLYNVVMPALSRLKDDPKAFESYFLNVLSAILWLTAPGIGLLAACSSQIFEMLLGPQWAESAFLFRIMAISAFIQPLHFMIPWALVSIGKTRALVQWGAVSAASLILCFSVGIKFGTVGVALAYAFCFSVVGPVWTFSFALPLFIQRPARVLLVILPPLAAGVCSMAGAALLTHHVPLPDPAAQLIVGAVPATAILLAYTLKNRHALSQLRAPRRKDQVHVECA